MEVIFTALKLCQLPTLATWLTPKEQTVTPEAKVKKKVVAILKQHEAYFFYPVTSGYGRSGVPDIIACHDGRFIGIECKAGKNKPTPLQQVNLDQIKRADGIALVINEENINTVEELFNG